MKNAVITILAILVVGLSCFIVYDKVIKTDEKKENNNEVVEQTIDLAMAKNLIEKYVLGMDLNLYEIKNNGLTENIKLKMAIVNVNSDKVVLCEDAFDFSDVEYTLNGGAFGCETGDKQEAISYSLVNNKYKELFGAAKEAPKTYALYDYNYSSKTDSYVHLYRFGTSGFKSSYYNVENAKINDNKLAIEITYIDYVEAMDTVSYSIDGETYKSLNNVNELSDVYSENHSTLPHLTFNFEKVNNDYILVSVNS